jgi:RNA polymerase sigma-70 factor (ECF subfamily)
MRRRIVPTLARLSDHELVARADVRALGELFDRHGGLAYGIALGVAGDTTIAAAAVQEAFEHVWSGRAPIGPKPMDVVASIARRARRSAIALRTSLPEPEPSTSEGPRARTALGALGREQRAVLELAYYRGLSETRIAELLSVTIDTVRGFAAGALAGLRVAE